jgi:hypothetical protein
LLVCSQQGGNLVFSGILKCLGKGCRLCLNQGDLLAVFGHLGVKRCQACVMLWRPGWWHWRWDSHDGSER